MPIDRRDDDERRARAAALVKQGRDLRVRARAAQAEAHLLIEKSGHLIACEERRQQRDALLRRATEALNIAKSNSPVPLFRLPIGHKKPA